MASALATLYALALPVTGCASVAAVELGRLEAHRMQDASVLIQRSLAAPAGPSAWDEVSLPDWLQKMMEAGELPPGQKKEAKDAVGELGAEEEAHEEELFNLTALVEQEDRNKAVAELAPMLQWLSLGTSSYDPAYQYENKNLVGDWLCKGCPGNFSITTNLMTELVYRAPFTELHDAIGILQPIGNGSHQARIRSGDGKKDLGAIRFGQMTEEFKVPINFQRPGESNWSTDIMAEKDLHIFNLFKTIPKMLKPKPMRGKEDQEMGLNWADLDKSCIGPLMFTPACIKKHGMPKRGGLLGNQGKGKVKKHKPAAEILAQLAPFLEAGGLSLQGVDLKKVGSTIDNVTHALEQGDIGQLLAKLGNGNLKRLGQEIKRARGDASGAGGDGNLFEKLGQAVFSGKAGQLPGGQQAAGGAGGDGNLFEKLGQAVFSGKAGQLGGQQAAGGAGGAGGKFLEQLGQALSGKSGHLQGGQQAAGSQEKKSTDGAPLANIGSFVNGIQNLFSGKSAGGAGPTGTGVLQGFRRRVAGQGDKVGAGIGKVFENLAKTAGSAGTPKQHEHYQVFKNTAERKAKALYGGCGGRMGYNTVDMSKANRTSMGLQVWWPYELTLDSLDYGWLLDNWKNFSFVNVGLPFPEDGVVTGWEWYGSGTHQSLGAANVIEDPVYFQVFRWKGGWSGRNFELVAQTRADSTKLHAYNSVALDRKDYVQVKKGDFVGAYFPRRATVGYSMAERCNIQLQMTAEGQGISRIGDDLDFLMGGENNSPRAYHMHAQYVETPVALAMPTAPMEPSVLTAPAPVGMPQAPAGPWAQMPAMMMPPGQAQPIR